MVLGILLKEISCGILVSGQQSGTSLMTFYHKVIKIGYQGGSFGIEGSIMTSLVLLLLILYLVYQLKKENERMWTSIRPFLRENAISMLK